MNTLSIGAASRVICEAMAKNRVPATIAVALDANGLLNTIEAAAELVALRARVAELEDYRNREVSAWLAKKAREYRSTGNREHRAQAEVLERMADKVSRGAIRPTHPVEDPHDSPLHHSYAKARQLEDQ